MLRSSPLASHVRPDELGLLDSCDAPTFLEAGATGFSDELHDGIGATLFDGQPPASRDDWDETLFREIRIIDDRSESSRYDGHRYDDGQ